MTLDDILAENRRRQALLDASYDPLKGVGSHVPRRLHEPSGLLLPETMLADERLRVANDPVAFERLRIRHDFEYWCARCVRVRHKLTGRMVPFVLNAPQRRVAAIFEADRVAGRPMRYIMLKARQWGGSTLTQMYMAWIQSVHRVNWHSLICAQFKDTAATIRGMYTDLLAHYPDELWDPAENPDERRAFRPFEGSPNIRTIGGRGCRVTLASAENPESVRGQDVAMAHLSETAYWANTPHRSATAFTRAIMSGIPLEPLTFVMMESTANGVANYFHDEWVRAEEGRSDKRPIFVPWYEIEMYRMPVADPAALWESLDDYEHALWDTGKVTLEMLNWYRHRRLESTTHDETKAEFPSTPAEAFISLGAGVFAPEHIERLRAGCSEPLMRGEIVGKADRGHRAMQGVHFTEASNGRLEIWHDRCPADEKFINRYVAVVDIGGRSDAADWSVIAVIERSAAGELPRVVAQWRGHIDHDLLAWKAAAIATYYHRALLVIESNTLETEWDGDSTFILEALSHVYPNLYYRTVRSTLHPAPVRRPGFHTNRSTKSLAVVTLMGAVREGEYIEASRAACDELAVYEQTPSGGFAAREGYHDDMLMTRAIGLYVVSTLAPVPTREELAGVLTNARW